ncbi:uncharacterized zinc-type alcohol dehydrogenase-like protein [Geodermatophilus amargosae]|uniref:Uncharacterized zinc-type alcohol dehydrogenase-like protein n=1 Tax=Geodermatophilus amargosae TaxID=1296565 RepID=A0A1I6X4B7_9ACTN|nr:uncharacterized zinc-type alcohol dehydrogenase-like protein [Geodermatophilus amargosae]
MAGMRHVTGYAAFEPDGQLRPLEFRRRDLRPDDVAVRGSCRWPR